MLFAKPFVQELRGNGAHNYDVAPDGQRFVMMETVADSAEGVVLTAGSIKVVLNWHQEPLERVPVP